MIKKLIPLFLLTLCLTSCAVTNEIKVENPDVLTAAVLYANGSVTAENMYNTLKDSAVATLTVDFIDMSRPVPLSGYDILYIDKSIAELTTFNASAIQSYVSNGGTSVVLDNELYNLFDYDFIGAAEFVPVNGCPVDLEYPGADRDIQKIQGVLGDFCRQYSRFSDYDFLSQQDYGVGVIPSTAQCIAVQDGMGIYTVNQYGNGYVFFTNPLLPNEIYTYPTTVSFGKLLRDYIAEYVSMKKYGYSIELVLGSYASPAAAWECYYNENSASETFWELCRPYGQIPSFTSDMSLDIQSNRAETAENSVSVPLRSDDGRLVLYSSNADTYSRLSARYALPLLVYNDCTYIYADRAGTDEKIRRVSEIVNDYGYIFAEENQLAKMTAAAYNTQVNAVWEDNGLLLSALEKEQDIPLYDENYQRAVGVKVTLAEGVAADEFSVDANVYYKKDNCIYVSLDKGARISKMGGNNDINIISVNLPAKIQKDNSGAQIEFLDGGMMTVSVRGNAKTTSNGWEKTQQNGVTVFRKYGEADTLKIVR